MPDDFFYADLVENKDEEEKSDSLVHGYSVRVPLLNAIKERNTSSACIYATLTHSELAQYTSWGSRQAQSYIAACIVTQILHKHTIIHISVREILVL